MSQHTIYRCDACPTPKAVEVASEHSVYLYLDRKMDAAGSMEDDGETIHLCHACCIAMLKKMTIRVPPAEVLKWVRERRKV